ncbi:hypothetical protein HDU67_010342 [Dinochytrium kinnereticum]|nr:hypothetical protein HDU67_010342 [Dinochytrium kinnereticum]
MLIRVLSCCSTYPSPFDSPLEGFAGRSSSSSSSSNSNLIDPTALLRQKHRQRSAHHLLQTPAQTPLSPYPQQPSPFFGTSTSADFESILLGSNAVGLGVSPDLSASPVTPTLFDSFSAAVGTPCSPEFLDLGLGLSSSASSPLFETLNADFPLFDAEPTPAYDPTWAGASPAQNTCSLGLTQPSPYMKTPLATPMHQAAASPMFHSMPHVTASTPFVGAMASPAVPPMSSFESSQPQPIQEPTVTISVSDLQALLKAVQNVPALRQAAIANALASSSALFAPSPSLAVAASPAATPLKESDILFGAEHRFMFGDAMDASATPLVRSDDLDFDAKDLFGETVVMPPSSSSPSDNTAASDAAPAVEDIPASGRPRGRKTDNLKTLKPSATTRVSKKKAEVAPSSPLVASASSGEKQRRRPSKLYSCPHEGCTRTFTRAFNLKTHIETHDPSRERPFACEDCGRDFVRVHDLQRHRLCHEPMRKFVCGSCGKGFTRRDALRRHYGAERLGCVAPAEDGESDEE